MGEPAGTELLKQARRAMRRDQRLRGALRDPDVIAAAEFVIATMRQAGVVPTGLNVLAHLTHQGMEGSRAAVLAAVAESRLGSS